MINCKSTIWNEILKLLASNSPESSTIIMKPFFPSSLHCCFPTSEVLFANWLLSVFIDPNPLRITWIVFLFLMPAAKSAHLLVLSGTDNNIYLYTIQYMQYLKGCFMDHARGLILGVRLLEADPPTFYFYRRWMQSARAPWVFAGGGETNSLCRCLWHGLWKRPASQVPTWIIISIRLLLTRPIFHVKRSGSSGDLSRPPSANMDWLLHFQKSQSSPDAPWLLNQHSRGGRGEAVICISRGASRPHGCRESWSQCHMNLPSALPVNKWIGGEFFGWLSWVVISSSRFFLIFSSSFTPFISFYKHIHTY